MWCLFFFSFCLFYSWAPFIPRWIQTSYSCRWNNGTRFLLPFTSYSNKTTKGIIFWKEVTVNKGLPNEEVDRRWDEGKRIGRVTFRLKCPGVDRLTNYQSMCQGSYIKYPVGEKLWPYALRMNRHRWEPESQRLSKNPEAKSVLRQYFVCL